MSLTITICSNIILNCDLKHSPNYLNVLQVLEIMFNLNFKIPTSVFYDSKITTLVKQEVIFKYHSHLQVRDFRSCHIGLGKTQLYLPPCCHCYHSIALHMHNSSCFAG